jgi:DNA-binding transcriptional LysR family regulator
MVRDGHCEFAVSYLPAADLGELTALELGEQEYWAVYPPGTPVPSGDPVAWTDLPDAPLVIAPRGISTAAEIEASIARVGRLRQPAAIVHHREARVPLVLAGVGGTFVDESLAREAAEQGAVAFRVTPEVTHAFGLIYDPQHLSSTARAFLSFIQGVRS